ncbi:hypothetical protein NDU88_000868 [Pleurodeles waltl]|uniref:Uncharacterized protein n=1 Tax=Pleurodeles waltl TaxID=8319 RepID=A0AAV7TH14_PLEWA|nr:hypothetical protein NDU88_000868 [Pleurodeles waltl]
MPEYRQCWWSSDCHILSSVGFLPHFGWKSFSIRAGGQRWRGGPTAGPPHLKESPQRTTTCNTAWRCPDGGAGLPVGEPGPVPSGRSTSSGEVSVLRKGRGNPLWNRDSEYRWRYWMAGRVGDARLRPGWSSRPGGSNRKMAVWHHHPGGGQKTTAGVTVQFSPKSE